MSKVNHHLAAFLKHKQLFKTMIWTFSFITFIKTTIFQKLVMLPSSGKLDTKESLRYWALSIAALKNMHHSQSQSSVTYTLFRSTGVTRTVCNVI
jgi:hypothetical protein